MAVAAHHGGLLAHANLAHVDALVQLAGEVPHQLAEVHALLRGKVADHLLATEDVLDAHGLHLEPALLHQLAEDGQGLLALARQQLGVVEVSLGSNAHDALQRRVANGLAQGLLGNLARVTRGQADLRPALRGAYDVVRLLRAGLRRVEPKVPRSILELHRYDGGHASASLTERSMTSRVS